MSSELKVNSLCEDGVGLLYVKGFVDAHTYEELQEEISDLMDRYDDMENIVIDISQVDYMSSAGIGVVVNAHAEISSRDGELVLVNPTASVREVFDTFGLSDMFTFHETVADAYAQLGVSMPSAGTADASGVSPNQQRRRGFMAF